MRALIVVLTAVALLALACSADDAVSVDTSAGGSDDLTEAVAAEILTSVGSGAIGVTLDESQAACAAERALDEVGRERLAELGLESPTDARAFFADESDPPPDVQLAFVDAVAACGEPEQLVELFTSGFPFELDDETRSCMADQFARDDVRRPLLEAVFLFPDTDFEDLPPEQAADVFTFAFDCIEFGDFVGALVADGGGAISDESVECLNREDTSELFSVMLADPSAAFDDLSTGDQADFVQPLLDCLSAEELLQLGS